MSSRLPERIVCLTEESTETLYLLGQQHRIVGISGFTVRPPEARKQKPKVSAFTSAKIEKILQLNPDLVIGFSDMQADIAATLIKAGVNVWITNQRSIDQILGQIEQLSCLVGAPEQGKQLIHHLESNIAAAKDKAKALDHRPRVYFEEWNEPLISAIRWVSELIEVAGGTDCFSELSSSQAATGRMIHDPTRVIEAQPEIIIGSWCGKRFNTDRVIARENWHTIPAIKNNRIHEIKSPYILQPGPAALTDGLDQLSKIITNT